MKDKGAQARAVSGRKKRKRERRRPRADKARRGAGWKRKRRRGQWPERNEEGETAPFEEKM